MSAADHGNQHQKYNHLSRGPDLSRMYLRSLQSQADTAARKAVISASDLAIVAGGPAELASHVLFLRIFLVSLLNLPLTQV